MLQLSVVRAHPQFVGTRCRRRNAQNGAVVLRLCRINRQSTACRLAQFRRVVGGQIRAQGFPRRPTIRAVMHMLRPKIQPVPVVGVQGQGRVPRKAQRGRVRSCRLDACSIQRRQVHAVECPALVHGIHLAIARRLHVKPIAKQDLLPILVPNPAHVPHGRRTDPRAVVLHASVDVVGLLVVDGDVVELADREVVHEHPILPSVTADVQAPVVAVDQIVRIVGVDEQGVVVGVHAAVGQNHVPRRPAIRRLGDHAPEAEYVVLVGRACMDFGVVERTVADVRVLALHAEGRPAVVGAVQRIRVRLHQGVHHVGVGRAHGQPHSPKVALGEAILIRSLHPRASAVVGHVQAAPFATAFEEPRLPTEGPHRRKQLVRVGWVHHEFGTSRALVHLQHVRPRLAPVSGLVHATVRAVAPRRPRGRHKYGVGVTGMNQDSVDVSGLRQAHEAPRRTCIEALEQPPTARVAVSRVPFTRAHPDQIRIQGAQRHCPNALGGLVVEQWLPGQPRTLAAPKPP